MPKKGSTLNGKPFREGPTSDDVLVLLYETKGVTPKRVLAALQWLEDGADENKEPWLVGKIPIDRTAMTRFLSEQIRSVTDGVTRQKIGELMASYNGKIALRIPDEPEIEPGALES